MELKNQARGSLQTGGDIGPEHGGSVVLMFDLNNTLIFTDVASGKTFEQCVSGWVSQAVFGTVDANNNFKLLPGDTWWQPDSRSPVTKEEGVIHYGYYLAENIDPKPDDDNPDVVPSLPPRETHTMEFIGDDAIAKLGKGKVRKDLKNIFVAFGKCLMNAMFLDNGKTNEDFQEFYCSKITKIIQKNKVKEDEKVAWEKFVTGETPGLHLEGVYNKATEADLAEMSPAEAKAREEAEKLQLSLDRYYIAPSFFHTLNMLDIAEIKYTVVFRTFGHDAHIISSEFDTFMRGEHPIVKRFSKAPVSKPIGNTHYHIARNSENFFLISGRGVSDRAAEKVYSANIVDGNDATAKHVETFGPTKLASSTDGVVDSIEQYYKFILENSAKQQHISIRDHHGAWDEDRFGRGKGSTDGKIIAYKPKDAIMFWDDNVEMVWPNIIDAREVQADGTQKPVVVPVPKDPHVFRADPIYTIMYHTTFAEDIKTMLKGTGRTEHGNGLARIIRTYDPTRYQGIHEIVNL